MDLHTYYLENLPVIQLKDVLIGIGKQYDGKLYTSILQLIWRKKICDLSLLRQNALYTLAHQIPPKLTPDTKTLDCLEDMFQRWASEIELAEVSDDVTVTYYVTEQISRWTSQQQKRTIVSS